MSHDSRNDDFFSEWDFSTPDWLTSPDPKPEAPKPVPEPAPEPPEKPNIPERPAPASVRRSEPEPAPRPSPSQRPEYTPRPRAAAPERPGGNSHRAPAARPNSAPRNSSSWEQAHASRGRGRKSSASAPMIIILVLLIGGMIFAAWQLGSIFLNYRRDRSAYQELAKNAISGLAEAEDPAAALFTPDPNARPEEVTASEIPFTVDWDYLASINSDIVGWLYCPDTVINYPVVQSSNHDFYLNHGFDGSSNTTGTLFVDRDSVPGIVQSNMIIYGHNMKDESMFGTFKHYVDRSYYEAHPTLYYLTPNQCYRIDLICAHIVEATNENFPGYFSSLSDYNSYLGRITTSAFWVNSAAVTTEYQLLTMSTCTSSSGYSDPRLLVQGMMIPIQ